MSRAKRPRLHRGGFASKLLRLLLIAQDAANLGSELRGANEHVKRGPMADLRRPLARTAAVGMMGAASGVGSRTSTKSSSGSCQLNL